VGRAAEAFDIDLSRYFKALESLNPVRINGKVSEIIGLVVEGHGPVASIGEVAGSIRAATAFR